jgi:hypothetical protein
LGGESQPDKIGREKREDNDNGKEDSSNQKGSNQRDEKVITLNHEVDKGRYQKVNRRISEDQI